MLNAQGDVYADLAEVLILTGKPTEAASALEQALERYGLLDPSSDAGSTTRG